MQLDQRTSDQAEKVGATFNARADQLRGNPDLNPDARARGMARAYLTATEAMTVLRDKWKGTATADEANLARELFGNPSKTSGDAVSARDASDRASMLTSPIEALDLLSDANVNSDETLARAVAARCYRELVGGPFANLEWADPLDAFAADRPGSIDKLNRLTDMQRANAGGTLAAEFRFIVPLPSELAGLSDYRIRVLAESNPPAPKAAPVDLSRPDMSAVAGGF